MKRIILYAVAGCFIFAVGCGKASSQQQAVSAKAAEQSVSGAQEQKLATKKDAGTRDFRPFSIFADKGSPDNHFIPSGFMPDGKCLNIDDIWSQNCHSGKNCIKIVYDTVCSKQGAKWAGMYWQNPANNWGSRKGGFDLTGATKLTFWAKGEKGGERIEEFKMGGVSGDYPDSDSAMVGPVILTPQWREYSIDLRGKDLSYVSGGFAWSTNVDVNPEGCTFYLDDLRYE